MTAHLPWSASGFSLPCGWGPATWLNFLLVILAHSWQSLMTLTETHPAQWWLFITKLISMRLWLRDLLSQCSVGANKKITFRFRSKRSILFSRNPLFLRMIADSAIIGFRMEWMIFDTIHLRLSAWNKVECIAKAYRYNISKNQEKPLRTIIVPSVISRLGWVWQRSIAFWLYLWFLNSYKHGTRIVIWRDYRPKTYHGLSNTGHRAQRL